MVKMVEMVEIFEMVEMFGMIEMVVNFYMGSSIYVKSVTLSYLIGPAHITTLDTDITNSLRTELN